MQTSERSQSIWKATQPTIELQPLDSDRTADVCVVGGGIAGLQVAYELARAGLTVIVLEAGDLGGGETGQTTAHLSSALDDRYFELERLHGREGAHLAYASHDAAIDRIETVAAEEGIACDFQRLDGYLFLAEGDTLETLERELAAAHRAGFRDVERQAALPLPSFAVGPCLRFPRQGQFHPLRYLAGLAEAILRRGGRIHPHTRVTQLTGGANASVETESGHRVRARSLVVATNTPINDRFVIHSKQAPYRTFVIGLRMAAGSIPRALYWDTADPYHYVRLQSFGEAEELLIVGGEDHKTGHHDDADDRHQRLEEWTRLRFPAAREVVFRWSGQVMEPFDGMAFIGRNPGDADNVYIATGDSGHGMTHGVIAGLLISDLILGREHPWATLYNPARKTPRAAMEYARYNLDVARSLTEWIRGGEVASLAAIAPGTGAVVRQGLRKLAAYRDESGRLTVCSAVCTHLGCIVHWNSAEQSWDCPCHGSRYSPEGEVLTGPATQPLERVEVSLPAEEPKRPPA